MDDPIKPFDRLELPFSNGVKADWTPSPFIVRGTQVVEDARETKNLDGGEL